MYSYKFARIDPKDGATIFYNTKGEEQRQTTDNLAEITGPNPPAVEYSGVVLAPYNASFLNSITYKNLTFSFLLISKFGNVFRIENPSYLLTRRYLKGIEKAWSKTRGIINTDVPNPSSEFIGSTISYSYANILVRDASYIKLREVSLSYDLRERAFKKLPIDNLRITLQGRNLWLKEFNGEGIDPEAYIFDTFNTVSGMVASGFRTFPIAATYSLGVIISF